MADAIITKDPENVKEVFSFGYAKLFDQQWPMWVGGLLLGVLNVFMFAFEKAWSVADGVRNWGNWFFNTINVLEITIIDPHLYSTSLLNFGIIVGALASALLAKQFQVRSAPTRELSKALIGGTLMGVGASLSFGCNIGGFFSAISALSMSGVTMMAGLMIGSFIGLKLLVWEITYLSPSASPVRKDVLGKQKKNQPLLGIIILLVGISLAFVYDELDYSIRGGFLMFGLMIGIIMQRTRFCFVRAFREPFMTGDGGASKAVVLAVIISVVGFSILKWSDMKDWEAQVSAGFWFGSLVGGTIFGIGMSLTGGCASGTLWRAGEGHIKLWVALIAFALSSSYFREWLGVSGWSMKLGEALFIPELIGWKMGILSVCLLMLVWYLIVSWNEATRKLVIV
ncbi:MAG: YeeE/YedE family protein [SAR324 cluster bacterium]|nr:YeeE/YedE family protein [SAR324 cluster bacterium]